MAVNVGNLAAYISADSSALTSGLGTAGRTFGGFVGGITGLVGKLGPLAAGIAGLAGVGGFGVLVKGSFESIDALAKLSYDTGIATEELAGLVHVAELSDVSSQSLGKSLQRMQRSISDASNGMATAQRNFNQLGLSIETLRSLSPEEQFIAIGEAIERVPNQADRTRFAMELMGRSGIESLRLLSGGSDELRRGIQEARDLGLAPSAAEAAQIEAANDAVTRMKSAFQGVANTVAIQLAPWIETAADKTREFVAAGVQAFGDLKEFAIDAFFVMEFGWQHLGELASLAFDMTLLAAVSWFEDVKDIFLVKWPAIFTWFGDNWQSVFFTAFDYVSTGFINLGKNIRDLWTAVLDFIAGRGFNFNFTPLTEGFHNAISELPDIPERELTAFEQDLAASISQASGSLSDQLGEHLNQRRSDLFGDVATTAESEIPEIDLSEDAKRGISELKGPGAVQAGSAEAFSSVFAAMRGDQKAQPTEATQKEMLTEQKATNREIRRMAQRAPIELVAGGV